MAALVANVASVALEVTLTYGRGAKIFQLTESPCREFVEQRIRCKLAPERLSERGDLRSSRLSVAAGVARRGRCR